MHTIRLRGPWQVEPICRFVRHADGTCEDSSIELPPPARVTMPADWAETCGPDFCGRVRYRRIFQMPTGLDTGERVFLIIDPPRSRGVVTLNDEPLGPVSIVKPPFRVDITGRLQDHNRLVVVVDHPALDEACTAADDGISRLPGGLVGEVRLEIEE